MDEFKTLSGRPITRGADPGSHSEDWIKSKDMHTNSKYFSSLVVSATLYHDE